MSLVAIVNPTSGRGHAAGLWKGVRPHLKGDVETVQTEGPGHATELAAQAIKKGAATIVAVGGDGTINEVVNGFFENDRLISQNTTLGIFSHGTGSDLQRFLQAPKDGAAAAVLLQTGKPRLIDLLKVRYTNFQGRWASRYSINITSFGMGGTVASRVHRSSKIFGGKVSFMLATLRAAVTFGGSSVALCFDQSKTMPVKVINVAIGNGRYHGGGMLACPRAVIDDGFFDVTVIQFMRLPELVRNLTLLYNGEIYSHPKVRFFRAKWLQADSKETTLLEIDGEPLGRLPVEISIVPQAIRVLA